MDVRTVDLFFGGLTILTNAFVLVTGWAWLASRKGLGGALQSIRTAVTPAALWYAWCIALVTTLGSLYYSEVAGYPPCVLCWYQRIAIYPMSVMLLVAAIRNDAQVRVYAIPILLVGMAISAYHYQLEWFPQQRELFCAVDNPCSTVWVRTFGYISLPFMAFSASAAMIVLMLLAPPPPHDRDSPGNRSPDPSAA